MEEFFEKGTLSQEQLAQGPAQRRRGREDLPGRCPPPRRSNIGVHALLDAIVDLLPVARRPRRGDGEATPRRRPRRRASPRPDAPLSAFVFKTLVDPHAGRIIALPRLLGDAQVRLGASTTSTRDAAERVGSLLLLQGKGQTHGPRAPGRRHRRGREAQGDADRRHARRQGEPDRLPAGRVPRAGDHVRDRAQDARRRRQDLDRAAAPARGGPGAARLARRADARDAALGHGPAPRRGRRRPACASATRSRSTSRSRRSPTARRSRARPRRTGATRSRPAATASSATARSG